MTVAHCFAGNAVRVLHGRVRAVGIQHRPAVPAHTLARMSAVLRRPPGKLSGQLLGGAVRPSGKSLQHRYLLCCGANAERRRSPPEKIKRVLTRRDFTESTTHNVGRRMYTRSRAHKTMCIVFTFPYCLLLLFLGARCLAGDPDRDNSRLTKHDDS